MQDRPVQSSSLSEAELGTSVLRIPRSGYPALATWRAGDPDSETSIYRKFDRLSARNYFFLQCQLLEPEAELDKHDEASWHNGTINSRLSLKRWETFSKKKKEQGKTSSQRKESWSCSTRSSKS